ncbi:MAG: ATP-binding protein [Spirochaetes bacterium]|nr:ATP-binding protein [Spirochaetota bacterium]
MAQKKIYPFAAIVGQEKLKEGLILNVINPGLSGILIRGEKGTAKSTAVRAIANILPETEFVKDCPFHLFPEEDIKVCESCPKRECFEAIKSGRPESIMRKVRVVELPVGATEDRVVGTMDMEHALQKGEKRIEPGILAEAHRGILYVDEVNLLDDHVVDVLLDSAAMGVNTVEREGVSFSHPARFTLVGTMNPEEGELRPQLLDRFGLCVNISGISNVAQRVEIMKRRIDFDKDPDGFINKWSDESENIAKEILTAKELLEKVTYTDRELEEIAKYCVDLEVDGHRGDIIMLKAARTIAAMRGKSAIDTTDIEEASMLALPHRMRKLPLQEIRSDITELRKKVKSQKQDMVNA